LPEAAWRVLHNAGLFRMKAPRELGARWPFGSGSEVADVAYEARGQVLLGLQDVEPLT
jgi:hypothetical protein